jgi:hypothetical protein
MGQGAPSTACACNVEEGIQNFSTRIMSRPTAWLGYGNQWIEEGPLSLCEVAGVRQPWIHPRSLPHLLTSSSSSGDFLDTLLDVRRL